MSIEVYYDPISNGFYQSDINKVIPPTALVISDKRRWELVEGVSMGKEITVGASSELTLTNREVDEEDAKTSERAWRDSELDRADYELNKVQDSDPKATGSVSDWRSYRKVLRSWPEHEDFPNKDKRPASPDA